MKKLYFFLALLGTFSMYGQEDYNRKISDVKTATEANEKEKKRLKKEISELNNKIDSDTSKIETNTIILNVSVPTDTKTSMMKSTQSQRRLVAQSRQPISFKIVGGNPYKYKYVINHKLMNFYQNTEETPFDKVIAKLKNNEILKEESPSVKVADDLLEVKAKLEVEDNNKSSATKRANKIKKDSIDTEISIIFRPLVENVVSTLNSDEKKAILKSDTPDTVKITKEDVVKLTMEAMRKLYNQSNDLLSSITTFSWEECNSEQLEQDKFKEKRSNFNRDRKELLDNYIKIQEDAISNGTSVDIKYKELANRLNLVLKEINTEVQRFNSVKFDNYILPIDSNGKNFDAIEITVERYEKDNPVAIDKYPYTIWMRGGLKIDISGGVFITSLVNGEYFSTPIGTEGLSVVRQRQKGNFEFGFGSTVNVSYRSGSWVNPTLNAGFLFTANQQFQFITGLGLILGKQERLIFSGGLAMGTVTRISESIDADGTTAYDLGSSGTIPTDNQFDFGYFFGLTYNLTKTKIKEP